MSEPMTLAEAVGRARRAEARYKAVFARAHDDFDMEAMDDLGGAAREYMEAESATSGVVAEVVDSLQAFLDRYNSYFVQPAARAAEGLDYLAISDPLPLAS